MIIDSHCHLDYQQLYENLDNVIKRGEDNKRVVTNINL